MNSGKLKSWLSRRIEICKKYGFQPNQVGTCVPNAVTRTLDIPQMSKEEYCGAKLPTPKAPTSTL
jgi:hypothetical protein